MNAVGNGRNALVVLTGDQDEAESLACDTYSNGHGEGKGFGSICAGETMEEAMERQGFDLLPKEELVGPRGCTVAVVYLRKSRPREYLILVHVRDDRSGLWPDAIYVRSTGDLNRWIFENEYSAAGAAMPEARGVEVAPFSN